MKGGKRHGLDMAGFLADIETCAYCPKLCRFSCPVAEASKSEAFTPWGRQAVLHQAVLGSVEPDMELADAMHMCLSCYRCVEFCEHEVQVPDVMRAARSILADRGLVPDETAALIKSFKEFGNPLRTDLGARVRSLVPGDYLVEGAAACLFLGCTVIDESPELIEPALKVMEQAGIDYVSVHDGNEQCCGLELYEAGRFQEFEEHAAKVLDELSSYKTVVTLCPECTYAMKVIYPMSGLDHGIEVLHVSEILSRHASGLDLVSKNERAVYFDPCHLGRKSGVFDQPRALAAKAIGNEPLEFFRNKRQGYCCGGGSLVKRVRPDISSGAAQRIVYEAHVLEAETIVTACPRCRLMLGEVSEGIEVKDLVELLSSRCKSG